MALRFMDGFDHYAAGDISKKWNATAGPIVIGPGNGRRGTNAYRTSGSAGTQYWIRQVFDAQSTWIVGCAFRCTAVPSSTTLILLWQDGSTDQCGLNFNGAGTLSVNRGGTMIGTTTNALSTNTYYYIEWRLVINNTTGQAEIRVNGTTWLNLTGQDTQNTSNATATTLLFGNINTLNSLGNADFDDIYICDGTGSAPHNTFLGDCRVDTLFPNAEGSTQQWTPSTAGTHYTLVDETAPNTTDYVSSITPTQRELFGMQDLTVMTGTIYGAQSCLAIIKGDSGSRVVRNVVRSSSSDSLGSNTSLSTGQLYQLSIHATDPATSTAWTESGINNAQVGAEVV